MTKAEINKILKFGKFKDINHFYEIHPNQDDEHTQQFMSEYNAYKNGGKIGMKDGGEIGKAIPKYSKDRTARLNENSSAFNTNKKKFLNYVYQNEELDNSQNFYEDLNEWNAGLGNFSRADIKNYLYSKNDRLREALPAQFPNYEQLPYPTAPFKNGGMMKSRLPKYKVGGDWDPFNPQPLEFSSGVPNYNIIPLTNEEVLANMAPSKPVTMDSINQSLGFFKTPGNAPVKTPKQAADFSGIANSVAQIGSGIVDSTTENDSVGGAAAKKGLNWAGTAASVALRPEVLAATGGFSALAIPVAGGIGAVLGGTDQVRENKYADFQNSANKRRRQNNSYNPNPYGMDSSYTMNAANGGNIGPSNIKNYYADGGEMVPLNSNTEQVEGNEPQLVDGVVKRDDRTGQPIAMVDHNEIIKDGQQVFSDEKKISKKAGLTRTFAKTAEILAKQKGKLETQLEKRGGQDVYTANAIKAVDRQMNNLFGLQERTATQMGLREPAPQQAMAMKSGGNLRGYDGGGPLMPYSIAELDKQNAMKIAEYERMYGTSGRNPHLTYGINPPQKLSSGLPDPLEKQKNKALSDMNGKTEQEKQKIAQDYYIQNNFNTIPNYTDINARGLAGDYSINSGRNLNDMAMAGAGIIDENMLKGKTINPFYHLGYVPGIHTEDNYLKGIEMAKKTTFDKNNNIGYTQQNPNPLWNSDWKQRLEYMKNNLNNNNLSGSNNNPSSLNSSDEGSFLERNDFPFQKFDNQPSQTSQPSQIYKGYDITNPITSLQPKGDVFMQKQQEARDTYNNPSYQYPGSTLKQKERRAYDVDENYLLSSLGNAAQMALLGRSEVVRPVFDPNESRTANYINNMRTKMNTRDSLNQLAQQNRLDSFNASQNSPTIAAAVSATNSAAKMDAINKLNQDKFNTEVGLENQKSQMQTQNSANAGANRQAAMNKAIEETAQNKGVTNTNRMAVMAKQSENAQESRVTRQQVQNINDLLKYHNIKGGFFKFDALQENSEAVAKVYNDIFSLPAEQQPGALKTLELMSSDPNKTKKLTEEEKQKRGITEQPKMLV